MIHLFLIIMVSTFFSSVWGKQLTVELSARSAILMNAETGAILFEKKSREPAYPASTTKIATALYVLDGKKADLTQPVLVSEEALRMKSAGAAQNLAYALEPDGTMMGLKKGEILTLDALLHGLMMISGNDAANVIAESISGSIPEFMRDLNCYLHNLGCRNTFYYNPHGLHYPEHVTNAYDLALMMKYGLSIPKFREIISKSSYIRPKSNKSAAEEILPFNQFIKPGRYFDPRVIGGKTGYHSQSLATLAVAAEHQGRTLIAVVLGCSKTSRYEDAKRLFDAAFSEKPASRLLMEGPRIFLQTIEGAEARLEACLEKPLILTYFPAEESKYRAFINWRELSLPIEKGSVVAEIYAQDDEGRIVIKAPLIAAKPLYGTWTFRIKNWFKNILGFLPS